MDRHRYVFRSRNRFVSGDVVFDSQPETRIGGLPSSDLRLTPLVRTFRGGRSRWLAIDLISTIEARNRVAGIEINRLALSQNCLNAGKYGFVHSPWLAFGMSANKTSQYPAKTRFLGLWQVEAT